MESAMMSRLCSEYDMPSVPIEIPSDTPMVLKRMPTMPACSTPSLTAAARSIRCMLHGLPSYHTDEMPTCDRAAPHLPQFRRAWCHNGRGHGLDDVPIASFHSLDAPADRASRHPSRGQCHPSTTIQTRRLGYVGRRSERMQHAHGHTHCVRIVRAVVRRVRLRDEKGIGGGAPPAACSCPPRSCPWRTASPATRPATWAA